MKAKILIVDDEAQFRDLLKAILEDADYIVTEAEDGAALKKSFCQGRARRGAAGCEPAGCQRP